MNTKKILAFMLSLAIVCPIGSTPMAELMPNITANAEDVNPTDESYFTFDADTGTITGYNTEGGTDVVIPSTIGDVAVTSIGNIAFYNCTSLKSITIPDSVTSIGEEAFYGCQSLTSINIPEGVNSIGDWAFIMCTSLKEINVDSNNKNYSNENGILFNKDKTILICYPAGREDSSYTILDSVTSIGDGAFYYCESLTSITIPDNVTSIGDWAFAYCKSLTSITIPDNVTSIGDAAFYYCESLTSITIPDGVTSISDWAFACTSLTSVTIPDSVTSIGDRAFYDCESLINVTIPNNDTSIGNFIFANCTSLSTIYGCSNSTAQTYAEDNGITFVAIINGTYTDDNSNISWIYYPDTKTLTITGTGAIPEKFYENLDSTIKSNMENVTIEKDITSIGEGAFDDCTSLKTINVDKLQSECENFSFPDGATVNYAFALTNNLENITSDNSATKISPTNTSDYTATLTADEGYTLPKSITVKVGNTTLTDGYTFVDGILTIDAKKVIGNISITATAEKQFTSSNLLKLKKHILGISNIDDISSLDVNQDNQLNIFDFLTIKTIILNQ